MLFNIIFSGIPPHVDTPGAFEDGIMSLSLLSQVKVRNTCYNQHRDLMGNFFNNGSKISKLIVRARILSQVKVRNTCNIHVLFFILLG
jgi:hypothetical protein